MTIGVNAAIDIVSIGKGIVIPTSPPDRARPQRSVTRFMAPRVDRGREHRLQKGVAFLGEAELGDARINLLLPERDTQALNLISRRSELKREL